MWPRISEIVLGLWLLVSPFLLGTEPGSAASIVAWIAGTAVIGLSAATFAGGRFRYANVGVLLIAAALIVWAWTRTPRPGPIWAEAQLLTGLVLALFAIVPTGAFEAPPGWRKYVRSSETSEG